MTNLFQEPPLSYPVLSEDWRSRSSSAVHEPGAPGSPYRAPSIAPAGHSARVMPPGRSREPSASRVRLHLKPGQKGTKQLPAQYGDRLVCVRYHFIFHLVGNTDHVAEVAHKALLAVETDEAKRRERIASWDRRRTATDALRDNRQLFLEVVLVRHVENFLNYLAALLYEIFCAASRDTPLGGPCRTRERLKA